MNLPIASVLVAIVLITMWRIGRARPLLLLLQPLLAVLLYFTLLPPAVQREAGTLVIATAATTPAQWRAHRGEGPVLALPEAPPLADVERVPDLATALRRHPDVASLSVIGAGLEARDREAVQGRALRFDPAPLAPGLVELQAPTTLTVGARWHVSGRSQGLAQASVQLRDPGGRVVASAPVDGAGHFRLSAITPAAGRMSYRLDLVQGEHVRESLPLPVRAQAGARSRVWLISGGPNAEAKYLQRWALDAGLDLRSQASLGGGLRIGDALPAFDAANLAKLDLLVLDERAWRDLGVARRRLLREAVDQGLGVMLRLTGPISAGERGELREWGFVLDNDSGSTEVALADTAMPLLLRQPLQVTSSDGLPLLRDAQGRSLGLWRAQGRGRVGLWWVGETWRLVLDGQPTVYGRLWSEAFATVARADALAPPQLASSDPRPNQRALLCALGPGARVLTPAGKSDRLVMDPAAGRADCAAWWPAQAGWHRVVQGEAVLEVFVRSADAAPGLRAQQLRAATQALVSSSASSDGKASQSAPGSRWPWFLAWLLGSALGWALERRRGSGRTLQGP